MKPMDPYQRGKKEALDRNKSIGAPPYKEKQKAEAWEKGFREGMRLRK